MKHTSLPLLAGLALLFAATAGGVKAASPNILLADASDRQAENHQCISQIQIPEGKEELSGAEIRRAIELHLIRVGVRSPKLGIIRSSAETVSIRIAVPGTGGKFELEVDTATGQIVDTREEIAATTDVDTASATPPILRDRVVSRDRLRRHIMGDGQPWGDWVGRLDADLLCGDDYQRGGPQIPDGFAAGNRRNKS